MDDPLFVTDKSPRADSRAGPIATPRAELIAEHLRVRREYPSSSYADAVCYRQPLSWIWRESQAKFFHAEKIEA
jgi:hypothetical protein